MFGTLNSSDYLEIGSSPYEEDCVQVGSPDYESKAKEECRRFKRQLEYQFENYAWSYENADGIEVSVVGIPKGASFVIKGFPHDFGRYYEVVVKYETDNEKAEQFAYIVEGNTPAKWEKVPEKEKAGPILAAECITSLEEAVMDSVVEYECPYCKQPRRLEVDASGLVKCEGCDKTYSVQPLI